MNDLCVGYNVSKKDAHALQRWWSRKGPTYLAPALGTSNPHRFSVWLQRTLDKTTIAQTAHNATQEE